MNGRIQTPLSGPAVKVWEPLQWAADYSSERGSYAVCILNQPLQRKEHLLKLCDHGKWSCGTGFLVLCCIRVCIQRLSKEGLT